MRVRFWGTRGSIAAPGPATTRFGGNTSCVEVRGDDGTLIVLDCGTGARALGLDLLQAQPAPLRVNLFIGHTHWDHIQGFPFFVPAFLPGTELNIYAPTGFQRGLEEALAGQMEYSYFPVKLRELRSRLHFTELDEGFFRVGEMLVETQDLNHTAPTVAYRITGDGATVAYVTDHEPFWPDGTLAQHPGDQNHIAFLRGADLVIHDAQYTEDEYRQRVGWGHSTPQYAVDVTLAASARRLALFHHDPGHDDAVIGTMEQAARRRAGGRLEVFAAGEGVEIELRGGGAEARHAEVSALRRRPIAGSRVLLVSSEPADVAAIEEMLTADDLTVFTVPDMQAALARGREIAPDLAIIDGHLPDGDGAALVRPLLDHLGRQNVPTVLLAETTAPADGMGEAFDYLAKPFSPPMLHARVRVWLARRLATGSTTAGGRPAEALTTPGGAEAGSPRVAALAAFPLFRPLTTRELERLVEGATEQTYAAGQAIVGEGELDDHVFVVLAGRVRVVESMPDTPAVAVLGGLAEGEVFGELSVLTGRPRSASVVALERTRCLTLDRHRFLTALETSPRLALGLLRMLARRLLDADRRLARYAPDPLTGLASRRAFLDQYRRMAAGARRRGTGVALVLFDVVQLRAINDRAGYAVGDDVLRAVADALVECTRANDLVARYGADEFTVLLLDAGRREADRVLPRVTDKLRELSQRRGLALIVQCQTGVACRTVPPETAEDLVREADEDLRGGRRAPPE